MKFLFIVLAVLGGSTMSFGATSVEIADAQQPQLCAAADGTVWLTYGRAGSVYVAQSRDGGKSFSQGQPVSTRTDLTFGMRRGPRIAAQGNNVTVAVASDELLGFSSQDGGKTWAGPVSINDTPGSAREGLHDLTVAPDGRLFATWLDQRNGMMEVWGAESTDAGKTWNKNQLVYHSPDKSVCECCHPSALFDEAGNLAVMWRNSIAGSRDLWMAVRKQGEKEFTAGKKLGLGTWPLNACPMDGGRIIALGGGKFASVWQRAGEVFYAPLEGSERRLGEGRQPVAVTKSAGPVVYWQEGTDLVAAEVGMPAKKLAPNARFAAAVSLKDGATILAYEQSATAPAPIRHGPEMHTSAGRAAVAGKTAAVVLERL